MTGLIPKPRSYAPGDGVFTLTGASRIVAGDGTHAAARRLQRALTDATGFALPVVRA